MVNEPFIKKVYEWVGPQLSGCPVRDGVTFYYHSEKIFKVLNRKKSWYIEFTVPVPECENLRIITAEEARTRKMGRTRWIYKGNSDELAYQLIQAALQSIPRRRVIEPALPRESRPRSDHTCPSLKRIEQIKEGRTIPDEITFAVKNMVGILQSGLYIDFVHKIFPVFQMVIDELLERNGLHCSGKIDEKIRILTEQQVVSPLLGQELQSYITRKVFDCEFADQERAYPMAIMLTALLEKLLKLLS